MINGNYKKYDFNWFVRIFSYKTGVVKLFKVSICIKSIIFWPSSMIPILITKTILSNKYLIEHFCFFYKMNFSKTLSFYKYNSLFSRNFIPKFIIRKLWLLRLCKYIYREKNYDLSPQNIYFRCGAPLQLGLSQWHNVSMSNDSLKIIITKPLIYQFSKTYLPNTEHQLSSFINVCRT